MKHCVFIASTWIYFFSKSIVLHQSQVATENLNPRRSSSHKANVIQKEKNTYFSLYLHIFSLRSLSYNFYTWRAITLIRRRHSFNLIILSFRVNNRDASTKRSLSLQPHAFLSNSSVIPLNKKLKQQNKWKWFNIYGTGREREKKEKKNSYKFNWKYNEITVTSCFGPILLVSCRYKLKINQNYYSNSKNNASRRRRFNANQMKSNTRMNEDCVVLEI